MESHRYLKKRMLKHKSFLAKLYKEKKGGVNKRTIQRASERQRKVLLNVLFCIVHGHIRISKAHFREVVQSKRMPKLVQIGKAIKRLLNAPETEQKRCLKQFSSLYSLLLSPLFN